MISFSELSYWEKNQWIDNLDFVVVGAGIVGSSAAYHLKQKFPSARILILERSFFPLGASTKNAGFACFGSLTELLEDVEKIGISEVQNLVHLRWEGLQKLQTILTPKAIDFQQKSSWDLIRDIEEETFTDSFEKMDFMNSQLADIVGNSSVFSWETNLTEKFGFKHLLGGFRNNLEGQIDTGKMMQAWQQKLMENQIQTLHGISVNAIESMGNEVLIQTNHGELKSKHIVVCVNGFAGDLLPDEPILPARAQVLITKPIPDLKIEGTFHYQAGYYYFRNIHNRILLGGGRNLDFSGETTTSFETTERIQSRLKSLLTEIILPSTPHEIEHSWAGIMGVGTSKKPIVKKINHTTAIGIRMGGMGVAIGSRIGSQIADLF
jgi:glycine/D-amino acid oxidase-like deaminating enzyme